MPGQGLLFEVMLLVYLQRFGMFGFGSLWFCLEIGLVLVLGLRFGMFGELGGGFGSLCLWPLFCFHVPQLQGRNIVLSGNLLHLYLFQHAYLTYTSM